MLVPPDPVAARFMVVAGIAAGVLAALTTHFEKKAVAVAVATVIAVCPGITDVRGTPWPTVQALFSKSRPNNVASEEIWILQAPRTRVTHTTPRHSAQRPTPGLETRVE